MSTPRSDPEGARALAGELRAVLGRLKRRLRGQTHLGDLTWSQAAVLSRLERDGPATVTALARAEQMRSQSMGTPISALETAGLITGAADPADKRQTILTVTDAGRDWLRTRRAEGEDWLSDAISKQLAHSEQDELARAVALLKRLVES